MKHLFFLLPLLLVFASCGDGKKEASQTEKPAKKKTEMVIKQVVMSDSFLIVLDEKPEPGTVLEFPLGPADMGDQKKTMMLLRQTQPSVGQFKVKYEEKKALLRLPPGPLAADTTTLEVINKRLAKWGKNLGMNAEKVRAGETLGQARRPGKPGMKGKMQKDSLVGGDQ